MSDTALNAPPAETSKAVSDTVTGKSRDEGSHAVSDTGPPFATAVPSIASRCRTQQSPLATAVPSIVSDTALNAPPAETSKAVSDTVTGKSRDEGSHAVSDTGPPFATAVPAIESRCRTQQSPLATAVPSIVSDTASNAPPAETSKAVSDTVTGKSRDEGSHAVSDTGSSFATAVPAIESRCRTQQSPLATAVPSIVSDTASNASPAGASKAVSDTVTGKSRDEGSHAVSDTVGLLPPAVGEEPGCTLEGGARETAEPVTLRPHPTLEPDESEARLLEATVGPGRYRVLTRWPLTIALGPRASAPALVTALAVFLSALRHGFVTAVVAGAIAGVALAFAVAAHEAGHLISGRHVRGLVPRILLLRMGGGASIVEGRFRDPRGAALFAAAGPAVSLALTSAYIAAVALAPWQAVRVGFFVPAVASAVMLGINLLPVAPTDGYALFRAALWAETGSRPEAERRAIEWSRVVLASGIVVSLLLAAHNHFAAFVALASVVTLTIQHHAVVRRSTSPAS